MLNVDNLQNLVIETNNNWTCFRFCPGGGVDIELFLRITNLRTLGFFSLVLHKSKLNEHLSVLPSYNAKKTKAANRYIPVALYQTRIYSVNIFLSLSMYFLLLIHACLLCKEYIVLCFISKSFSYFFLVVRD